MHLLLLLTLFAVPATVSAQLADALGPFETGNRHYQEGAYAEAVHAYEQALASGFESGALYHNLGNAYLRLDQLGQAIRYYEKARRLLPGDARLQHSLAIARSRIDPPMPALPVPAWRATWEQKIVRHGAFPFFAAGFAFYLAAAGLFGYRTWSRSRDPWLRRTLAATLSLGLVLLTIAFAVSLDRQLDQRAVVVAGAVPLHEAPQASDAPARTVPEGVLVRLLTRRGDWIEVRLPDGATGWLPTAAVGEI